ncbi:MAG: haloacid dehalogenase [Flavobacteriales bacterium]|nr:haloacid dehalogenase [Flavobacteriales bacterium]
MKNIKSIIFDLGGVLLNISYQNTIDEFKKLGVDNSSTFYSKKSQTNIFNLLETGKISENELIREILISCKSATRKQIIFAWNSMLLDLPKNRTNLLENLKEKYQLFLLSNTNAIHIKELKSRLGKVKYSKFYNLFNKVYYSHEISVRKPHSDAFHLVLDENNLKEKEVLFIDDSPQHIEGAKEVGIHTYHLKDNEEITTVFPDIVQ